MKIVMIRRQGDIWRVTNGSKVERFATLDEARKKHPDAEIVPEWGCRVMDAIDEAEDRLDEVNNTNFVLATDLKPKFEAWLEEELKDHELVGKEDFDRLEELFDDFKGEEHEGYMELLNDVNNRQEQFLVMGFWRRMWRPITGRYR